MISFVPLWEGDICSPNLWWDHRNCCTSLCSLQIRAQEASLASISPPLHVFLAEWLKKDKGEIFPERCIVPCPAWCTEEVGREDEKSCGMNLALVPCNCSENRELMEIRASKLSGWRRQGCQLVLHQPVEYLLLHMISVFVWKSRFHSRKSIL